MRLKPNDAPCMELNEKRNFQFKLSGAVGANSITGTPTVTETNGGLTVGTVSTSGTTVTVPVTAAQAGAYVLKVQATLSSAEIIVGVLWVKVTDSTLQAGGSTTYD
jgi:hypothetical protein